MSRITAILLVVILLFGSMTACSGSVGSSAAADGAGEAASVQEGNAPAASGSVRVLLAGFLLDDGIDAITNTDYEGLNNFWERTFDQPDIICEFTAVPWDNAQQKQQVELTAGNVDVLYCGSYVGQFYEQGLLRDLDDLIEGDTGFDSSIYPQGILNSSYTIVSADGKQFGLPAVMGQRYTVFDRKLFDDWGVEHLSEYPTTDEIIEKAAKMTGINPVTGEENYGIYLDTTFPADVFTFASWAYAFKADGGTGHPSKPKEIQWNLASPEMKNLFNAYGELVKYAVPGFATGTGKEKFATENNDVAIYLDWNGGSITSQYLQTQDDAMIKRFGAVMNVGPNGEGWVACDPMVMAKNPQNVEASWEVLKHLAGYERQKYSYENFRWTPAVAEPDFIDDFDVYTPIAIKIADHAQATLIDEANPFYCSEITPVVTKYHSDIIAGKTPDVDEILSTLQKKAEEWSAAS